MAYNEQKLAKLAALKALAQSMDTRLDALESVGAQANVIEGIQVNGTDQTVTGKKVNISVPEYSIVKDASSGDYAAVYHLTKGGTNTGAAINIPKDMVVQSGEVVTYTTANKPSGVSKAGTYIKLVLQNVTDPLYIDVGNLIEYVTSGSAVGDMVVVTVDGTTHKVTAAITDGTITKAKLHTDLQAEIDGKATKVSGATNGHLAGLDANGNITDSGKAASSLVTSVTKGTADGTISVNGGADVALVEIATDAEVTEMLSEVFGTAS